MYSGCVGRVHRHSENIVHRVLDDSLRDIDALQMIRLAFVVNEGFPDLHVEIRFVSKEGEKGDGLAL